MVLRASDVPAGYTARSDARSRQADGKTSRSHDGPGDRAPWVRRDTVRAARRSPSCRGRSGRHDAIVIFTVGHGSGHLPGARAGPLAAGGQRTATWLGAQASGLGPPGATTARARRGVRERAGCPGTIRTSTPSRPVNSAMTKALACTTHHKRRPRPAVPPGPIPEVVAQVGEQYEHERPEDRGRDVPGEQHGEQRCEAAQPHRPPSGAALVGTAAQGTPGDRDEDQCQGNEHQQDRGQQHGEQRWQVPQSTVPQLPQPTVLLSHRHPSLCDVGGRGRRAPALGQGWRERH